MLDTHYHRAGDTHHNVKVQAAPPGESIRYADDIRKELISKAEAAFKNRVAVEFEDPDLGKIKLVVAERLDYGRNMHMVYYKLNDAVHNVAFDPYVYGTRQQMFNALFDLLSQSIASRLLLSFSKGTNVKLFGDVR